MIPLTPKYWPVIGRVPLLPNRIYRGVWSPASEFSPLDLASLTHWWIGTERLYSSPTAIDNTVRANDGTLTSGAWSSDVPAALSEVLSSSLDLNGVDTAGVQVVGYGTTLNGRTALTISFWMKQRELNIFDYYLTASMDANTDIRIYNFVDNAMYIEVGTGTDARGVLASYPSLITADTWAHLCLVYDGAATGNANRLKFYIDGVLMTLDFGATTIGSDLGVWDGTAFLQIGSFNAGTNPLDGKISDVRFYSVAKDAAAVLALSTGTDDQTSILDRWPLNDPATNLVDTNPIPDWRSHLGEQLLETTNRPVLDADAVNGFDAPYFDGVNDKLVYTGSLSGTTHGGAVTEIRTGPTPFAAARTIWAVSNTSNDDYLRLCTDATGKVFIESDIGGVVTKVTGNTILAPETNYTITVTSTGTAWAIWVDDIAQTLTVTGSNSGNWISDIASRNRFSTACLVLSGGASDFYEGHIAEMFFVDDEADAA